MPHLLALDCATRACSVAVADDNGLLAHRFEVMERGQAERLLPMVQDVMAEADQAFADLDGILVTRGPGAFTGLRIGLSAARGLSLAAGIPCFGLTTTAVLMEKVLAEGGEQKRPTLAAIDSKRGDLFIQAFHGTGDPVSDAEACRREDLGERLRGVDLGPDIQIIGDGAEHAIGQLESDGFSPQALSVIHPDALYLVGLSLRLWPLDGKAFPPDPLYLRPPDAKVPKDGGRLRPRAESSRPDRV